MRPRHISCIPLVLCFSLAISADRLRYDPPHTRVAILPLLNLSGEKWEDLKQRQVDRGNDFLRGSFAARGFQLIDPAELERKTADLNVDLSDEEQQKRATLYQVGKAVDADLIVFAIVTDTDQSLHHFIQIDSSALCCSIAPDGLLPGIGDLEKRLLDPLLPARREGKAKLKLWLLDVKNEKPILSAKTAEGRSGGGYFAFFDKGSKRQVIAVANALQELLKGFFKDYPVQKDE